jgi:hypothetical protein
MVFLFLPAGLLFGSPDGRTLVYYFRNISGEEKYVDLVYTIPMELYNHLKENDGKTRAILVDDEGFELYRQDNSTDLWETGVLLKIGRGSRIDRILFGSYYVQNGKPVLFAKIFYIRNGIILTVGEEDEEIGDAMRAVESSDVSRLLRERQEKKIRGYSPPFGRILSTGSIRTSSVINTCMGTIYPLGEWAGLYPPGIIGEISLVHYPKINRFPAGLGFNTNYVILRRKNDAGYVDSDVKILSIGGAFHYMYRMKRFVQGVSMEVNGGLAVSNLNIDMEVWDSVDPYVKIGFYVIAKPFNIFDMTFKMGLFSIDYKERPIDALYTEVGVLFF